MARRWKPLGHARGHRFIRNGCDARWNNDRRVWAAFGNTVIDDLTIERPIRSHRYNLSIDLIEQVGQFALTPSGFAACPMRRRIPPVRDRSGRTPSRCAPGWRRVVQVAKPALQPQRFG
jgi:hypothetical protein